MSEATSHEVLREAVARHRGAVLSLPAQEGLRHFKTRFLGEEPEGIWIDAAHADQAVVDELVGKPASIGVAFKAGPMKAVFASNVLRREPEHRLAPGLKVHAILLRMPEKLEGLQRRSNYRVQVPDESELAVRVWRIPDFWVLRDKPSTKAELAIRVRDMSTGGLGLYISPEETEPLKMDQRLRVQIQYGTVEVLVEARVRFVQALPDKITRIGTQFMKLDADVAGRQTLSRLTAIFGVLRRDEVRRLRQELMSKQTAMNQAAA